MANTAESVASRNLEKKSAREKSKREKRKELSKEILKGLALGGLVVASFALPNLPKMFSMLGIKTPKEEYRARRALANLARQKLIKITDKGDEQIVEITEAGKKRTMRYKFDDIFIERPPKWDGLWRVIMFDIPEKHKKGRDALSRKLKEMEFYPLQKSVFVFPFKCKDELDFICEIFNIRKFVYYFAAKSIDNEKLLKQYYDL